MSLAILLQLLLVGFFKLRRCMNFVAGTAVRVCLMSKPAKLGEVAALADICCAFTVKVFFFFAKSACFCVPYTSISMSERQEPVEKYLFLLLVNVIDFFVAIVHEYLIKIAN